MRLDCTWMALKEEAEDKTGKLKKKKKQQQPQDTIVAKELDRAEVRHTFK